MAERLPHFQRHSETSREAAVSMYRPAATLRARVLAWFAEHGPATDEEMIDAFGLSPSSVRPRRVELVEEGRIEDSGARGVTRSGRRAVRWQVKAEHPTAQDWEEVFGR